MKKMILTDFNLPRWNGINMKSIEQCLEGKIELFGELEHPPEHLDGKINSERISIRISDFVIENNVLFGTIQCVGPMAEKAKERLNSNGRLSIRGQASRSNGIMTFKKILTWDVV